jgi:hypothetical protein
LEHWEKILQVLAAGEIGHDPTILFVQIDLAVHPLAHQGGGRIEARERGFVAGTFYRQYHRYLA